MVRFLFSFMLVIHGIIHMIGYIKEWKLGPAGRFTGKTLVPLTESGARVAGVFWLLACILLIAAAVSYYTRQHWFWLAVTSGLIISQALIILYWEDAKWGTIINVPLLVMSIFSIGTFYFQKGVSNDIDRLFKHSHAGSIVVSDEQINKLPPLVQTWLVKSQIVGREMPNTFRIIQQGSMKTDPSSAWLPYDATQHFSINPPAFVWSASIHTDMFVDIVGRDKYENGKGNMLIKAASLIPIANSSGKEIDEGTMLRFMAEMVWFPHAATSDYLSWSQLDSQRVKVTMQYEGVTAEGIYSFNSEGFPVAFEAQRFREADGKFTKETWLIKTTNYDYFNNVPIAQTSEVTWKLKEGDFTWLRLSIEDVIW